MPPQPLIEFANFRATSNVGAYGEVFGARRAVDRYIKESIRRGELFLPLPPGVVKAHDAFLSREGRASRRLIDIPDPSGDEGLAELNSLIDRVVASRHETSLLALLASLEVDLDWIRESNEAWRDAKRSRVQHRFERAIERVVAALQGASDASILLYRPTPEPIVVAVQALSDELLAYIVRHPSTLHELVPGSSRS